MRSEVFLLEEALVVERCETKLRGRSPTAVSCPTCRQLGQVRPASNFHFPPTPNYFRTQIPTPTPTPTPCPSHPIPVAAVRLLRIDQGGAYADIVGGGEGEASWGDDMRYLERTLGFRTLPLDVRDARQVSDLVAGSVRWRRYLDYLIAAFFKGEKLELERLEPLLVQVGSSSWHVDM